MHEAEVGQDEAEHSRRWCWRAGSSYTSGIIARAAMKAGLNVVTAETHGMAQRGGSVEVHVRIGDVKAPLIPEAGQM